MHPPAFFDFSKVRGFPCMGSTRLTHRGHDAGRKQTGTDTFGKYTCNYLPLKNYKPDPVHILPRYNQRESEYDSKPDGTRRSNPNPTVTVRLLT